VSVAWFTRLYELNEAGRFDDVVRLSKGYLAKRPKDYALHLQRAKALLSLGELDEAGKHLDAAVKGSKGLAAWPWFYVSALHARRGERAPMYEAMETSLRLDANLADDFAASPFFAAFWRSARFKALLNRTAPRGSTTRGDRAPASPPSTTRRRAAAARGRTRAGASARRRGGG
jgi:tetratricopeptide (TPR) repeat protein